MHLELFSAAGPDGIATLSNIETKNSLASPVDQEILSLISKQTEIFPTNRSSRGFMAQIFELPANDANLSAHSDKLYQEAKVNLAQGNEMDANMLLAIAVRNKRTQLGNIGPSIYAIFDDKTQAPDSSDVLRTGNLKGFVIKISGNPDLAYYISPDKIYAITQPNHDLNQVKTTTEDAEFAWGTLKMNFEIAERGKRNSMNNLQKVLD